MQTSLEDRISRLEATLKNLRTLSLVQRFFLAVSFCAIVVALIVGAGNQQLDTISAERFLLRDQKGLVFATLEINSHRKPSLKFFDVDSPNDPKIVIELDKGGDAIMSLRDKMTKSRIISGLKNGIPILTLIGSDAKTSMSLQVDGSNELGYSPAISFWGHDLDEKKLSPMELRLNGNRSSSIEMRDEKNMSRIKIELNDRGSPTIKMTDDSGGLIRPH